MERRVLSRTAVPLQDRKRARTTTPSKDGTGRICVAIVSKNRGTADALESYLHAAGVVPSHADLFRDGHDIPACAHAAVIFPDDYGDADALGFLLLLRQTRPHLLALLITRTPQRFRAVAEADGRSLAPLVLPRPSACWTSSTPSAREPRSFRCRHECPRKDEPRPTEIPGPSVDCGRARRDRARNMK